MIKWQLVYDMIAFFSVVMLTAKEGDSLEAESEHHVFTVQFYQCLK